jgi:hypothetical protein
MSENKSVLEQVLEHLLAEDEEKASELLHGFMVEKSRSIYESLLDEDALEEAIEEEVASEETVEEAEESDEEAVEEAEHSEEEPVEETVAGSPSEDFYDEVEANINADESGVNEEEDDMEPEMPEMGMDGEEESEEGEEEVEDRVDDLEEATTFSKPQSAKNDSSGDNTASPKFPKKESFGTSEKELFGNDGSEGKKGGDTPKSNPSSDNMGEKPKAAPAPKVASEKSASPIAGKVK